MNVRTICLAILYDADATGYEIRKLSTEGEYCYFVDASYVAIYPALQKLEREGWIARREGLAENNRRVSVYSLTASGRRQLARRIETWNKFSDAVGLILQAT